MKLINCTVEEVFDYAEQLLLEEKTLAELAFLDSDDRAKITAVVNRGMVALAEERKRFSGKLFRSANEQGTSSLVDMAGEKAAIFLVRRVGIELFPLELVFAESGSFCRKLLEQLCRQFSAPQMAALLLSIDEAALERFLAYGGDAFATDVRHYAEKGIDECAPLEIASLQATYSFLTISFLLEIEDASFEIQKVAKQRFELFRDKLKNYLQALPKKMLIIQALEKLDETEWKRLSGLTPRSEMAMLHYALPSQYFEKLIKVLPSQQKADIKELIHFKDRQKQKGMGLFLEVIESLRQWIPLIKKLQEPLEE